MSRKRSKVAALATCCPRRPLSVRPMGWTTQSCCRGDPAPNRQPAQLVDMRQSKTVPKLFQNCPKLFHRNGTFLNGNYENLNSLYFFILKDTHYHTTNNTIVRALLISNQKVFCNFETKMCSKTVPKLFKTVPNCPKLFRSASCVTCERLRWSRW